MESLFSCSFLLLLMCFATPRDRVKENEVVFIFFCVLNACQGYLLIFYILKVGVQNGIWETVVSFFIICGPLRISALFHPLLSLQSIMYIKGIWKKFKDQFLGCMFSHFWVFLNGVKFCWRMGIGMYPST